MGNEENEKQRQKVEMETSDDLSESFYVQNNSDETEDRDGNKDWRQTDRQTAFSSDSVGLFAKETTSMRKRRARPAGRGDGDCFPRKRYQAKRIPGVPACDPAIWLASARLHGNSPEIGAQSQSSPRNSPGGGGGEGGDRDRDEGGGSDGGDRGGSKGGVGGGGDGFVFRAYGKMVDHVFGVATDALVTAPPPFVIFKLSISSRLSRLRVSKTSRAPSAPSVAFTRGDSDDGCLDFARRLPMITVNGPTAVVAAAAAAATATAMAGTFGARTFTIYL
ncbi:hypothetical protein HZH68_008773 [Vespula germanica]|uniref:Uncharacterized protein n=1 Tax=Vespula germanica TaxID=30212 RepID=A0A834JZX9_VESGE|nr:hypothetical protein HZH68_008773 [Vespula germanica]